MARRVLLVATSVELATLIVTGIALFFVYRPSGAQSWAGAEAVTLTTSSVVRAVHGMVSTLLLPTALATVVVLVLDAARRAPAVAAGVAFLIAVVASSFTGYLLPWDQLALWAVSVGDNIDGFVPLLGDEARFVLIDGVEVGPDTIVRWLAVHALVLTPLVTGLLGVLWRRQRRVASAV